MKLGDFVPRDVPGRDETASKNACRSRPVATFWACPFLPLSQDNEEISVPLTHETRLSHPIGNPNFYSYYHSSLCIKTTSLNVLAVGETAGFNCLSCVYAPENQLTDVGEQLTPLPSSTPLALHLDPRPQVDGCRLCHGRQAVVWGARLAQNIFPTCHNLPSLYR